LFIDTGLPFGLGSTPKIFTAIANVAEWIVKQAGVNFLMHYLDDFLVIKAPDSMPNSSHLLILTSTFRQLGLPVAEEKLEGPSTCLAFLGFEVDSQSLEISHQAV